MAAAHRKYRYETWNGEFTSEPTEAANSHLNALFPGWQDGEQPVVLPFTPTVKHLQFGPHGKQLEHILKHMGFEGENVTKWNRGFEKKLNGDLAELDVVRPLIRFLHSNKIPAIVLWRLKISRLSVSVLADMLRTYNKDSDVTYKNLCSSWNQTGGSQEVGDVLVVSPELGVLVIQVKFSANENRVKEAINQFECDEKFLKVFLSEINTSLSVTRICSIPSAEEKDLIQYLESNILFLTSLNLETILNNLHTSNYFFGRQEFIHIVQILFILYTIGYFEVDQNSQLVSRQASLKQVILHTATRQGTVLQRIHQRIIYQETLQQVFKLIEKGDRTQNMNHKMCIDDFKRLIYFPGTSDSKYILLTPEQRSFLNSSPRISVLVGAPGTGKTLLMWFKAIDLLKTVKNRVRIVLPTPILRKYYETALEMNLEPGYFQEVVSSGLLSFAGVSDINELYNFLTDPYSHLIYDDTLPSFRQMLLKSQIHTTSSMYIACDFAQTWLTGDIDFLDFYKNLDSQFDKVFRLTLPLRSTPEITTAWASIRMRGNKSIETRSGRSGIEVKRYEVDESDLASQLVEILKKMLVISYEPSDIAIVGIQIIGIVEDPIFKQSGIAYQRISEVFSEALDLEKICVAYPEEVRSLEWPVVIAVARKSIGYSDHFYVKSPTLTNELMLMSRSTVELHVIIVPENENKDTIRQLEILNETVTMSLNELLECAASSFTQKSELNVEKLIENIHQYVNECSHLLELLAKEKPFHWKCTKSFRESAYYPSDSTNLFSKFSNLNHKISDINNIFSKWRNEIQLKNVVIPPNN